MQPTTEAVAARPVLAKALQASGPQGPAQAPTELLEVWPRAEPLVPQVPVPALLLAETQELPEQALRVQESESPESRGRMAPDGSRLRGPSVPASPAGPDPDVVPASQAWLRA